MIFCEKLMLKKKDVLHFFPNILSRTLKKELFTSGRLCGSWGILCRARSWIWWCWSVPFNSVYCIILWFCKCQSASKDQNKYSFSWWETGLGKTLRAVDSLLYSWGSDSLWALSQKPLDVLSCNTIMIELFSAVNERQRKGGSVSSWKFP